MANTIRSFFEQKNSKGATPAKTASPACQKIIPEHAQALGTFFERLKASGAEEHFHPHPLTGEEAKKKSAYSGKDFYCVLMEGKEVIGYGMLRGWDEGYEVPSLGIAIDPAVQGRGYGRRLMQFLHAAAAERGAKKIRLKVYPANVRAAGLYRSLGYVFQGGEDEQLTGFFQIAESGSQKETAR
ncbi:MAG TPA: GNAT family N-acetyltransferase [Verrucomicrobiae bacterium]|nr:GNAT family N-acetyltransferase [Verrucomicrobiae bacterium]